MFFLCLYKAFKVLDRANVKKILEEQAFQESGCTDSACVVEIGKAHGYAPWIRTALRHGHHVVPAAQTVHDQQGRDGTKSRIIYFFFSENRYSLDKYTLVTVIYT